MRRLFLFRPEPGARHTAERAKALGLDAVTVPLFEIEPIEWTAPDPAEFDALLITSANSLRLAGEQMDSLRSLPVHAVGEATAFAATVAGFGVATVGTQGAEELLASIEPGARLLHLCGEDRRTPEVPGRSITCVTVYRAKARSKPFDLDQLQGHVAAVHSPRAARRLAELVDRPARSTVRIAAISPAAAEAAGTGWKQVESAGMPSDSALLALAARLCES